MSVIDVESLLAEISDDAPCGEDLEYDAAMGELERSAQGKEEQQFGDTIIPGEEPDWREVKTNALAVLGRTHDIRVIPYLARALTRTDGYPGLLDALAVLRGYVDRYWETVHPELDADDDNDPTMRVNVISSLCDIASTLNLIREAPLVNSRALGRFSLKDLAIAAGDVPAPEEGEAPDTATIEGAFMDVEVEELQATANAVSSSFEHASEIESALDAHVGAASAPDLESLRSVLQEARRAIGERLERRGAGVGEVLEDGEPETGEAPAGAAAVTPIVVSGPGEIRSREDVVKMLDKACEFYEKQEPSSPVPLLLKRARKLVYMDFLQIVQDLVPDGYSQAETFRGVDENE